MKRIRIIHFKRDDDGRGWTGRAVATAGTWGQARAKAKRLLGSVVTTRALYHHDIGRADWCELERRKPRRPSARNCWMPRHLVHPDAVIVPSVGELGWTP